GAAGSASDDLDAVMKDFQADNKITPCLFTSKQLKNAKSQIPADFNIYAPEFKAELNNEIKRWQKRGCSGGTGALRIVKAKGKGGPRSESVTIKNTGATAVNLKGYALRNTARKKLRLTTIRLAKGQTLRVITGCATGKQTASRAGSRHYACKRKQQWKDRADVAELVRRSGGVIGRRRT
ncbi:MAG: lamin tail domain-containing protein, partial [Solirubrobacteraceae bacterium]